MAGLSLNWELPGAGWARCAVSSGEQQVVLVASYLTEAPEDLLEAVLAMELGTSDARCQFDAEPDAYRWIFRRTGSRVNVEIKHMPDGWMPDEAGRTVWHSRHRVAELSAAVLVGFDRVLADLGTDGYRRIWRSPFPWRELEALRSTHHQAAGVAP